MFIRKKLSIIMATLFLLNQKTIADQNANQNLDMKMISQVIEDYDEKLRPQKKELINRILEILDSFPEDYFLKILKTYESSEFNQLASLAKSMTLLNALVDKESDENLEQKLKEIKIKAFKCILDNLKDSITPDIKSRINIQVHANFKNEIFSQEDEVYIIAAVGAPLLDITTQWAKLALYTNLSNAHCIKDLIDFDLKHNTLVLKKESINFCNFVLNDKENINFCNIVLNDDESLTVKIFNNKQEIASQFVLKK